VIDGGRLYLTSSRYATVKGTGAIENNVYDPKKIKAVKPPPKLGPSGNQIL